MLRRSFLPSGPSGFEPPGHLLAPLTPSVHREAMAAVKLTPNGVGAALAGDTNLRRILQVVNLRCVNVDGKGTPRSDRYRGLVSDDAETCPAMFAGQLSNLARSGVIHSGAVVQLDEYVTNLLGGKRLRFLCLCTVLDD